MIAARNGWVLAFDDISTFHPWFSDGLRRLATGSSFATRELFTDDDEVISSAVRPVTLNGIGGVVTRPDLLDRSLVLTLPEIRENRRRDERELRLELEQMRPRVLGALFGAVTAAVKNRALTALDRVPRLADFARWLGAGETRFAWVEAMFNDGAGGSLLHRRSR